MKHYEVKRHRRKVDISEQYGLVCLATMYVGCVLMLVGVMTSGI